MPDRPSLSRDIYERYITDDREVSWPHDAQERVQLARALLGKRWVTSFDYWLDHTLDLLGNPEPSKPFPRKNEAYKKDKYFRDGLSSLSPEQNKVVWDLIRTVAEALLFSALVDLDQGRHGDYVLAFHPRSGDGDAIQIAPDEPNELHDDLYDWILSFSKYAVQIVEVIEIKGGWQFQDKKFYLP